MILRKLHRSNRKFPLLCLLAFAPFVQGALWESNDWALTGILNGSAGYDSNLTVRRDGPGDGFVAANPFLTFARRNSSTDFRIDGGITETAFINNRQSKETDLNADIIYAYPNADNVIPIYRVESSWLRSSQPDQYLGERIPIKKLSFDSEGYVPLTGKLGLRGTIAYQKNDYDSILLNQSQRGEAFLGLAFERDKRAEFSLNLGAAYGKSQPNDTKRGDLDVHSREFYFTTRVRGELTPKLTGSIYAGLGRVNYTGEFINKITIPVAGADLTWKIDSLRSLVLTGLGGANYSPDGQIDKVTRASLRFTHAVIERWQYSLQAGSIRSTYTRTIRQRTDDSWDWGAEFAYLPSRFFRISLGVNYTTQTSDSAFATFKRNVISLGAAYRL